MKLRSAIGITMIWLATVAGVSATAWFAIDRAGRDISGAGASSLSLGPGVVTATPLSSSTPEPSESKPNPTITSSPRSTTPSPAPPSQTTPSSPTPRDRTVIVTGGQVSVRCTGAVITLRIAQPDNGWRVELDRSGPDVVQVAFQRGDTEAGGHAHVNAVCSAGTPVFSVATND